MNQFDAIFYSKHILYLHFCSKIKKEKLSSNKNLTFVSYLTKQWTNGIHFNAIDDLIIYKFV